jgi:hypothetical protein
MLAIEKVAQYYHTVRGVGHSTRAIRGVCWETLVLAHNAEYAKHLEREHGLRSHQCVSLSRIDTVLKGQVRPMVVDHAALCEMANEVSRFRSGCDAAFRSGCDAAISELRDDLEHEKDCHSVTMQSCKDEAEALRKENGKLRLWLAGTILVLAVAYTIVGAML